MADGPSGARHSLDQAALNHPAGKRAEGLVALEGQNCQVVQGRSRILVQVAERVPLDEADPEGSQAGVERPVVAHLQTFDGEPDALEWPAHLAILILYQDACISMSRSICFSKYVVI